MRQDRRVIHESCGFILCAEQGDEEDKGMMGIYSGIVVGRVGG